VTGTKLQDQKIVVVGAVPRDVASAILIKQAMVEEA